MNDADKRFHEQWLGMVQPSEGLVVSLPVLVDAQCVEKLPRESHVRFLDVLEQEDGRFRISDLVRFLDSVLELPADRFHDTSQLPQELHLYVPEGRQSLRPTRALLQARPPESSEAGVDTTPASLAARPYAMLVWEVPPEIRNLDKPETVTGTWEYPAQAKFERLLRECRVPIGLLSNGWELRLVYAPHGESSGRIAFRVDDMASVSGRPIFDAMVMLLSRQRWFGVDPERQLPAILAESRRRNADVTNELSRQVFEALEVLLNGFAAAEERDGTGLLREALEREDEHLYAGLLAVLLRLVFLLYCEDRALLPVEHPIFEANYSLLGLFDQLQSDHGRYPDTMHRRFGAYPRLVSLFRAVFLGVKHGDLEIPSRRGDLFNPNAYPFLEGWGPEGSAPITQPEQRASVKVPSVDDLTVYTALHKLLYLDGQRLSYKALDVEQIGSVYEALMGFAVQKLEGGAIRIRLGSKKGAARVWVEAERLLALPKNQRAGWLQDELGFDKAVALKIVEALGAASAPEQALQSLEPLSGRTPERAGVGALVIQPGPERRRTSSHYTPRALTEPIVARTLEPLIKAMGDAPASETLLNLVICDPAMGSGAFLVAVCRHLADHVVAAWTREGKLERIADAHDDVVNHARRLVAQRCLYGVDKNKYAVQLARLSLWLVTMARNEPFTFVDHALRHGDSLVGLNFDQIRAFHWKPAAQVELTTVLLKDALDEAIGIRQQIQALAAEGTLPAQREKERLLFDAEDALDRVRLIGDLVIGAFFSQAKDKDRQKERDRRLALVEQWLAADRSGDSSRAGDLHSELRELQADLRRTQVPFHWMVEFPEVFYAERPDPLERNLANGAAFVEAFVGNPPFLGQRYIVPLLGASYRDWLFSIHTGTHGRCDVVAQFLRRICGLAGNHGVVGILGTNTVVQGDTRESGIAYLVQHGWIIYGATAPAVWEGDAAVTVVAVHLAVGTPARAASRWLFGHQVSEINSILEEGAERPQLASLGSNSGMNVYGLNAGGNGFVLDESERAALVSEDPSCGALVPMYIGGEDVVSSPQQCSTRYIIDFSALSLAEAAEKPRLLEIVRERVKPERDRMPVDSAEMRLKTKWWQFRRKPAYDFRSLSRVLVTAVYSSTLGFCFQPTDRAFNNKVSVFQMARASGFAVLQSRVHAAWVKRLAPTMGAGNTLVYTPSECFDNFPFPASDPNALIPEVEDIGERVHALRAGFMLDMNQGLTKTYNALKDPGCEDPRILELRVLHEEMDRAVLAAYGWSDIVVPPYCPMNDEDRTALQAFEDEVIDRLFVLNAQRAEEEKAAAATQPAAPKRKTARTKKSDRDKAQLALPGGSDEEATE